MSAERFYRTGTDHSWSAPMTSMQRERAEAPFADDRTAWAKMRDALAAATWRDWVAGLSLALMFAVLVGGRG